MVLKNFKDNKKIYALLRIVAGVMFSLHGFQKLFGLGGSDPVALASLMGVVGIIEFLGGLLLALGIFTRVGALGGFIVMIGAQIQVHFSTVIQGDIISAGNERAILYLFLFLFFMSYGAGTWSLEKYITKRKKELV